MTKGSAAKDRKEYLKEYLSNPEKRARRNYNARKVRERLKLNNPLRYKAQLLIGGLRWGKGGTERMEAILKDFLGRGCVFCGTKLTLDNCSLDHNLHSPRFSRLEKKRRKLLHRGFTDKRIKELNDETNLHIVCLNCNRTKGNLTGSQFLSLIRFLDKDLEMKKIVLRRLRGSNFMWTRNG